MAQSESRVRTEQLSARRELAATLFAIAGAAAWASYRGTLPGRSLALRGAALQGLLWASLFAALGAAYYAIARSNGGSGRRALRRLTAGLLLALFATHLLLVRAVVGPATWHQFFYLQWLVPPTLGVMIGVLLLPRETITLYRAARADPDLAAWLAPLILLASAAVLASASDSGFEWGGLEPRLRHEVVRPDAWATNVALVFAAYLLVFAVTARILAALLAVTPVYAVLTLATLLKIRFMHAAVQPLDLLRLPEFAPLFQRFFGTGALVALLTGAALWLAALATLRRAEPWRVRAGRRVVLGAIALALLFSLPVAIYLAPAHPALAVAMSRVGVPDDLHREKARANGVLLSFLTELRSAFVAAPAHYSADEVARAVARHPAASRGAGARGGARGGVNLILYVVESFMDPDDLGLHYTSDPIPNVRAAGGGRIGTHGIVPERFGGSANTEFEVLTGMTMAYLPEGSLPFRQYIRQPVPSLPRTLGELGYATTAVQADAKYYYNREQAYDLLGFQHVVWLNDVPGVERAARPGWPSDRAVVQAVIEASRGAHPFFVFAFPSSTHSPYNSGVYRTSTLDVTDPQPGDTAGEVKEYINTLRVADQAIGALIGHFRHEQDSTIIAVVGDHLAPLSSEALQRFFAGLSGLGEAEVARRTRRVPMVVWANFRLPEEPGELSLNALPLYLLDHMGVRRSGFLSVADEVRRRYPVVTTYVQDAAGRTWSWDSLPPDGRELLEDYRLLEYDVLLGKQYSGRR